MRSTVYLFLLLLSASAFGSSPVTVDSATAHVRSYQYSFLNGNLAANWSFESDSYFWSSAPRLNRSALLFRCGKSCQPVTGSYAMVVVDGGATQYAGESDLIPVDGGQTYSLSQFVLAEESVTLYACNTGAKNNGFASKLATKLGVVVRAPNASVFLVFSGSVLFNSMQTRAELGRDINGMPGRFVPFKP